MCVSFLHFISIYVFCVQLENALSLIYSEFRSLQLYHFRCSTQHTIFIFTQFKLVRLSHVNFILVHIHKILIRFKAQPNGFNLFLKCRYLYSVRSFTAFFFVFFFVTLCLIRHTFFKRHTRFQSVAGPVCQMKNIVQMMLFFQQKNEKKNCTKKVEKHVLN